MIAHLLEAYGQIWDEFFGFNGRFGKLLKAVLFLALGIGAILYAVNTEANKETRESKSFDVILDQNRQLLGILEAQNRLVTDRLNLIEERQYQLQTDIHYLSAIQSSGMENFGQVAESADEPKTAKPAAVTTAPPAAKTTPEEQIVLATENSDIETRAADIQTSIENLKQLMAVEVQSEQSTTVQQTEQSTGN